MKLLRYGPSGQEKPGILDADGVIRDLSGVIPDIAGETLGRDGLARLADTDWNNLPIVDSNVRLGPPVAGTKNFVCIGLNYADHAAETGAEIPEEPVVFLKSLGTINGPNDDILIPEHFKKTDWEVELAVIIGSKTYAVSESEALGYVAGYCVCNDVSEREWQLERGGSWDKGKAFDSFGPIGPWLVTADEVPEPQALDMFLEVDGRAMQQGSTRTMVFNIPQIISYVSRFMTLHPGDVITTGTPPGVGLGKNPPEFLSPGQTVRLGIDGLGEQTQRTVAID